MIERLADRILEIRTGHPVRVGVDGPSAAGKTTLADRLADVLRARTARPVIRAQLDHFMTMVDDHRAHPYDSAESFYLHAWDCPAIRARLLAPLGPGGDRRHVTAPGGSERVAPDDAILLADGVFLQRPELDAYWDLRVYLHIDRAGSLRRAVERDRHWMGGEAEAERRYRTTYLPAEQRYADEVRPREHADIVIDGYPP
jgi:uridine kinase